MFGPGGLFVKQNNGTLVGVVTLPLSFLPSRTQAFYFINRPPRPNILKASVGAPTKKMKTDFPICVYLHTTYHTKYKRMYCICGQHLQLYALLAAQAFLANISLVVELFYNLAKPKTIICLAAIKTLGCIKARNECWVQQLTSLDSCKHNAELWHRLLVV